MDDPKILAGNSRPCATATEGGEACLAQVDAPRCLHHRMDNSSYCACHAPAEDDEEAVSYGPS